MSVRMVDVTPKPAIYREATARGEIYLKPQTVALIREGKLPKGDPVTASQLVGIQAAKRLWELLPLCHQIPLSSIDVNFTLEDERIVATSTVKGIAQTGVEMEALAAVSVALLNIWDMVKALEKDEGGQYPHTRIANIRVVSKIKGETETQVPKDI